MLLEATHLSKAFGSIAAVKDVSFKVARGEAYGLLGPNGAGKSTTIAMLFGLLTPDAGEILVDGVSLKRNPATVKQKLGYVPQEVALYDELTAEENLSYWGKLYGLKGSDLRHKIAEALEIVGLTERQKGHISTFSGGMKRRINIAAALLHDPEILIMDEPTVGIDPQSRNHILETVKTLNKQGTTIIYTSHYMEEVEYICTRIGIIDNGQLIAEGSVDELRRIIGDQSELQLKLTGQAERVLTEIQKLPQVSEAYLIEDVLQITTSDTADTLAKAAEIIARQECVLCGVNIHESNLEAVFLHLTGHALRD